MDFAAPFVAKAGDPIKGLGAFTIVCGAFPVIVSFVFAFFYSMLADTAGLYNDFNEEVGVPLDNPYDWCNGPDN